MKVICKVISIVILLSLMMLTAQAQKSKISKAKALSKKGDYTAALNLIKEAEKHKKTKDSQDTYLAKAEIYKTLMIKKDSTSNSVDDKYFNELNIALNKIEELKKLNPKKGDAYTFITDLLKKKISIKYFNLGVQTYNDKNEEGAYQFFSRAYYFNKENLPALQNMALMGTNLEKYEEVEPLYDAILSQDSVDVTQVYSYINLLAYKQDKYDKAINVVERMIEKFPNEVELKEQEVNIYIKANKLEMAKNKLESQINSKENPTVEEYVRLGQFYDHLDNPTKAIECMQLALKIDSENSLALQNIGVLYYNDAVDSKNKLNKMSDDEYAKKAKKVSKEINNTLVNAEGYFERLVKVNPTKANYETLRNIYSFLKKHDKWEEVDKVIKNLPKEEK